MKPTDELLLPPLAEAGEQVAVDTELGGQGGHLALQEDQLPGQDRVIRASWPEGAGSREQGAGSREQGAGSRDLAVAAWNQNAESL